MHHNLATSLALVLLAHAVAGQIGHEFGAPHTNHRRRSAREPPSATRAQVDDDAADDAADDADDARASYKQLDAFDPSRCGRRLAAKSTARQAHSNSSRASLWPQAGSDFTSERISAGRSSYAGEFPWYAYIRTNRKRSSSSGYCGGVIVHSDLVLTAAHCLRKIGPGDTTTAQAGVHTKNDLRHAQTRTGAAFCKPSKYTGQLVRHTKTYDLALIRLERPFEFNQYVQPACLPDLSESRHEPIRGACELAGYGKVTNKVMATNLMAMPLRVCGRPSNFADQICFRTADGKKFPGSPCRGDSGSAVYCRDQQHKDRHVAVALVSNAPRAQCKRGTVYGVEFASIVLQRQELIKLIERCAKQQ